MSTADLNSNCNFQKYVKYFSGSNIQKVQTIFRKRRLTVATWIFVKSTMEMLSKTIFIVFVVQKLWKIWIIKTFEAVCNGVTAENGDKWQLSENHWKNFRKSFPKLSPNYFYSQEKGRYDILKTGTKNFNLSWNRYI